MYDVCGMAGIQLTNTTQGETTMNVRLKRIDNDVNGNPRYLVHFSDIAGNYDDALKIAKKQLRARAYRAKGYKWCLVFTSYAPVSEFRLAFNKEAEIVYNCF